VVGSSNFAGANVSSLPFYQTSSKGLVVGSDQNGCRIGILKFIKDPSEQIIHHCEVVEMDGKFYAKETTSSKDDSTALLVLKTPVYKGGRNFHTGDRRGASCLTCQVDFDFTRENCSLCGKKLKVYHFDFPGTILAQGTVRDNKRPVFGSQIICTIKKGQVIRTAYDGFTFGKPGCHYHLFDGKQVISTTWSEREKGKSF